MKLTKHRTILRWLDTAMGVAVFANLDDDSLYFREAYELPEHLWQEMEEPTTITVTIEPGDKLNNES